MDTSAMTRILCVDDEPNVLEGLARTLRRRYDVSTAVGAHAGWEAVKHQGPFAVVMSDLRMPGVDGVTFLSRVRELAPDTVRVLLTGQADMESAIGAVNRGAVFRFLTKPCDPEWLHQALAAAAEQYRLVTAERVLLEQTLHGSIKALADVLALVNPTAFGRAARIKALASELLGELGGEQRWQIEVAAMLSQIGLVTLPAETVEKLYRGDPLTHAESLQAERLPRIASELIATIPRMEEVREILAHQGRRFESASPAPGALQGERIPLGSRLLKLVLDFDMLETRGLPPAVALDTLRGRDGWYDPTLLAALARTRGTDAAPQQMVVEVELRAVRPGMVFADDVKTPTGVLLIARGQEVTDRLVERVRNFAHLSQGKQRVQVILPVAEAGAPAAAAAVAGA